VNFHKTQGENYAIQGCLSIAIFSSLVTEYQHDVQTLVANHTNAV